MHTLKHKNKRVETLTFSFLKRVRTLPSSLSTRRRSCSLFWQLRMSLMKTESPRMPDNAISAQIHFPSRTHAQTERERERKRKRNREFPPELHNPRSSLAVAPFGSQAAKTIENNLRKDHSNSKPKCLWSRARMRFFRERERLREGEGGWTEKIWKSRRGVQGEVTTFIYHMPKSNCIHFIFHPMLLFVSDQYFFLSLVCVVANILFHGIITSLSFIFYFLFSIFFFARLLKNRACDFGMSLW